MNVLIGGAWPYANGSLHVGHLVSLLPGDVIARYYRKKGSNVIYVSGSDCHGTPISIKAKEQKVLPEEISSFYHNEFKKCFTELGFTYDLYTKTSDENHIEQVQEMINKIYDNGHIYEKVVEQIYCESCNQFLSDRYVSGTCYICNSKTNGDQCTNCSTIIDPKDLINPVCKICGDHPVIKESSQLFFRLTEFNEYLNEMLINNNGRWRENAINLTQRYLDEGLRDRSITRDIENGIRIPIKNHEHQTLYVWFDAVLGYLTGSKKYCEDNDMDWESFWNEEQAISYYIHGKDNIPFHTVIFPSLVKALNIEKSPDYIISSEFLNIKDMKISTSENRAIWVKDLINKFNSDSIRYYLISNSPEKRDSNFTWSEFINNNNGELAAVYGNFVNRTLTFTKKYYNSKIPEGVFDNTIRTDFLNCYDNIGSLIEKGELKEAISSIFKLLKSLNKYFDVKTPWITRTTDEEDNKNTIYTCLASIVNIANILEPFLPFSSDKIMDWFREDDCSWNFIDLKPNKSIKDFEILFEQIDETSIDF